MCKLTLLKFASNKRLSAGIPAFVMIIGIAFNCMLTGCAGNVSKLAENEASVTITDHNGNQVTLPANIERIAVCDILPLPSVLSVFFDSADKIVAMSPASMSAAESGLLSELYPEILKADTSAISGTEVNTEELMKLNPEVVFYNAATTQLGESLRKAGFNAVAISVNKWNYDAVETLNQWIELLSEIFPEAANNRASQVRTYSEEMLTFIKERTDVLTEEERARLFFLFQYSEDSIVTSGNNFFGEWWAEAIGATNVAAELTEDNSVKVTLEQVYSWNPDIILMTNFTTYYPEALYDNAVGGYDWSGIEAVNDNRVYKMPLGMYRSYTPGVDTPITLLWLAKTVYPELFSDVDVTEKTREYYHDVFEIELSKAQAQSIFAPAQEAGKADLGGEV